MKKRFGISTLALILACSLAIPAGAAMANAPMSNKIESDMNSMASAYLNTDAMSVSSFNEDGTVTYAYAVTDEVISYVTVRDGEDGSVVMDIQEGTRRDVITIDADGAMWVNDLKIEVTAPAVEVSAVGTDSIIMPLVATQYRYSTSPFLGTSSSYTKYGWAYSNPNVPLGKAIRQMTAAAIGAILATYLAPGDAGVMETLVSVSTTIAADIRSKAEQTADDSRNLSYKITVYTHPQSNSFDNYLKHSGTYYTQKSYNGSPSAKTFYEYRYYNA